MRVPSPVELTCADPNAPCTLPNIFVADPPLQPVRRDDLRARRARPRRRRRVLQRRDLPHRPRRRHPVHQRRQRRRQRRLLPQCRRHAPAGRRAHRRRDARRRSAHRALQPARRDVPDRVRREQPEQFDRRRRRRHRSAAGRSAAGLPRNAFRLRADWTRGPFALGVDAASPSSCAVRARQREQRGSRGHGARLRGRRARRALADRAASGSSSRASTTSSTRRYQNFGILGANYFRGPGNTFDAGLAGPEPFRSPRRAVRRVDRHPVSARPRRR